MIVLIILLLVVTVICAGVAVIARLSKGNNGSVVVGFGTGAGVALAVTILVTLVASYNEVGTQNIGVVTAFGRPSGEVDNGIHWLAPWKSVTQVDGAIQTQTYEASSHPSSCITVRIGEQQTACADVVLRWRIDPLDADSLFRNYHGGASVISDVSSSLVHPYFIQELNTVLDNYDPVTAITASIGTAANPHLYTLSAEAQKLLQARLSGQVEVLSVTINRLTYQSAVAARISELNQQDVKTAIARQSILTAEAQATAQQKIASSVSHDPNVLVAQCMNTLAAMQSAGQSIPPGFSCWPGGSGIGVIAGTSLARS